MQRVVYLPQGRSVTLGSYVQAWRLALSAPEKAVFNKAFTWYPQTKQEVLREFRFGLHDRINRRIDGFPGTLRPLHTRTRANTTISGNLRLTAPQFSLTSDVSSSTGYPPG